MKSVILSFILTAIISAFFMGVFETKTSVFINKIPVWVFIIMAVIFLAGYLLALYWGFTGIFKEHRLFNFLGIGFSLLGLSIYLFAFIVQGGMGSESAGQFDHAINKIEMNQRTALDNLIQQTNTKALDIKMVAYWEMTNNPDDFALCVQHGNIIGLQIKNKQLSDVMNISKLSRLNWLIIENCNLKSIAGLNLPALERLAVNHNQLTNLTGLENSPKVTWLNFQNNPVTDSAAIKNHPNKGLYIINE